MSESFEKKIEQINEERKKLLSSNSFDEITQLWKSIKQKQSECENILKDLEKKIKELEEVAFSKSELEMKFEDAFKEIKILSENAKTTPILELPQLMARLQQLRNFCLTKLEQESVKVNKL